MLQSHTASHSIKLRDKQLALQVQQKLVELRAGGGDATASAEKRRAGELRSELATLNQQLAKLEGRKGSAQKAFDEATGRHAAASADAQERQRAVDALRNEEVCCMFLS